MNRLHSKRVTAKEKALIKSADYFVKGRLALSEKAQRNLFEKFDSKQSVSKHEMQWLKRESQRLGKALRQEERAMVKDIEAVEVEGRALTPKQEKFKQNQVILERVRREKKRVPRTVLERTVWDFNAFNKPQNSKVVGEKPAQRTPLTKNRELEIAEKKLRDGVPLTRDDHSVLKRDGRKDFARLKKNEDSHRKALTGSVEEQPTQKTQIDVLLPETGKQIRDLREKISKRKPLSKNEYELWKGIHYEDLLVLGESESKNVKKLVRSINEKYGETPLNTNELNFLKNLSRAEKRERAGSQLIALTNHYARINRALRSEKLQKSERVRSIHAIRDWMDLVNKHEKR